MESLDPDSRFYSDPKFFFKHIHVNKKGFLEKSSTGSDPHHFETLDPDPDPHDMDADLKRNTPKTVR